jgi:hypothetical protein
MFLQVAEDLCALLGFHHQDTPTISCQVFWLQQAKFLTQLGPIGTVRSGRSQIKALQHSCLMVPKDEARIARAQNPNHTHGVRTPVKKIPHG